MALLIKKSGVVIGVIEMMPERLANGTLQKTGKGHLVQNQGIGVEVVENNTPVKVPDKTYQRPKELEMMDRALRDYTGYSRPGLPPDTIDEKTGNIIWAPTAPPKIKIENVEKQCHTGQLGEDALQGANTIQIRILPALVTIPKADGFTYLQISNYTPQGIDSKNYKIIGVKNKGTKNSELGTVNYYEIIIQNNLPSGLPKGCPINIKR